MFYGMLERLIRCFFFCGKSDRMHFRALCVAAISVSGSQLKVQKESFPRSSLQKDRTSPNRDTLPNLWSRSKKTSSFTHPLGTVVCESHTEANKVPQSSAQSRRSQLGNGEPRDAQSSSPHHNPRQILPTVIKTLS